MSKDTVSSITVDDISQAVSGINISDKGGICGSCTDNTTTEICANCGKEGDSLKSCAACMLVKYCSRDCQASHRPQHKKECRRRVAELHDERLFKDPPPLEDCPICFVQLPISRNTYKSCCGKVICSGCIHAVYNRDEEALCPFCRAPTPESDEEIFQQLLKRADASDAQGINNLGFYYADGIYGLPQDFDKALELWERAAKLGSVTSYYNIGNAYYNGRGVEQDEKKAKQYWEKAAMKGDVNARHNLAVVEENSGNMNRAINHYMIAAGYGQNKALKNIQILYSQGKATKEDYTKALRSYQKYLDEVKSDQRDEAAAFDDEYKYLEGLI